MSLTQWKADVVTARARVEQQPAEKINAFKEELKREYKDFLDNQQKTRAGTERDAYIFRISDCARTGDFSFVDDYIDQKGKEWEEDESRSNVNSYGRTGLPSVMEWYVTVVNRHFPPPPTPPTVRKQHRPQQRNQPRLPPHKQSQRTCTITRAAAPTPPSQAPPPTRLEPLPRQRSPSPPLPPPLPQPLPVVQYKRDMVEVFLMAFEEQKSKEASAQTKLTRNQKRKLRRTTQLGALKEQGIDGRTPSEKEREEKRIAKREDEATQREGEELLRKERMSK